MALPGQFAHFFPFIVAKAPSSIWAIEMYVTWQVLDEGKDLTEGSKELICEELGVNKLSFSFDPCIYFLS